MDKVEAKHDMTYVFGEVNKVFVIIKRGQRWYVLGKDDTSVCLERDNVRMQMLKEEFDSLFVPSRRVSYSIKYG